MWVRVFTIIVVIGFWNNASLGQLLYELVSPNEEVNGYFGHRVAYAGDVNGDEHDDVIVGAFWEGLTESGRAYVFNGATGELLHTFFSPNMENNAHFGGSVSGVGDVNVDGYDDIAIGAGDSPGSSPDYAGRVYVFSGLTGDLIYTLVSPNEEWHGAFLLVSCIGDVDDDGCGDIVVGAGGESPDFSPDEAGRAYVFSGATGELLHTLVSPNEEWEGNFGTSVSGAGDVNNDGYVDVIVSAPGESPQPGTYRVGRVYVFSGADWELLYCLASANEQSFTEFGDRVACAGDINNDGYDDVIVGACNEAIGPTLDAGRAYAFSGMDGRLLHTLVSPNVEFQGFFGISVAGGGDLDQDGYDDMVVGAANESPGSAPHGAGRAYVFSGSNGELLNTLVQPDEEGYSWFGISVASDGDVNNDEYCDVIVGAWMADPGSSPQNAGRAYVFSGFLIPVELSIFEAETIDEGILIRWQTESEHQCFGFHLYRQGESDNGRQRITQQIVPGGGTSAVPRDYSYLDSMTAPGTYQYWLEEVAEDGKRTEFGPAEATIHPTRLALNGPNPHPIRDAARLKLRIPNDIVGESRLRLFDLSGRQIGPTRTQGLEDGAEIRWNALDENVSPGVYWWLLTAGNDTVTRPMVVVK